ncbi:hypothetical protein PVAND_010354 [Polypedilum vanderplanki]|uniref:Abasic site processing protein HMCES n=1 Tax=Polypedilum vanderplanki TaxID=319348 RepID=A0A9J6CFA6_POLVA|nr:hypothetical protein PVAND_010354 [Polypedilum vanderplanki]
MCGRTACTLKSEEIICSCKYKSKNNREEKDILPKYRNEYNLGKQYIPKYNLAPSDICLILVSSKHFSDNEDSSNRTLIPALWGLIPRWHKGDYKKHGLTTNNARLETLESSKLFNPLLERGKRCVMVIEGFYEWKTTNSKLKSSEREVFFIHMPQINEHVKMEDKSTWKNCEQIRLMYVAGLFDIWYDDKGDSIYSFTVITFESNDFLGWLHHRTPAILETEEQITTWLDYENFSRDEALRMIKQPKTIIWYEVSNYVNNIRNQTDKCKKPLDRKAEANKGIMKFFNKRKKDEEDDCGPSPKKQSMAEFE